MSSARQNQELIPPSTSTAKENDRDRKCELAALQLTTTRAGLRNAGANTDVAGGTELESAEPLNHPPGAESQRDHSERAEQVPPRMTISEQRQRDQERSERHQHPCFLPDGRPAVAAPEPVQELHRYEEQEDEHREREQVPATIERCPRPGKRCPTQPREQEDVGEEEAWVSRLHRRANTGSGPRTERRL